ncbi:MAG TPA: hypothetical protein VF339_11585 [Gammaproteobacteria bacterium]
MLESSSLRLELADFERQGAPSIELGRSRSPVADFDVQLLEVAPPEVDLTSELGMRP